MTLLAADGRAVPSWLQLVGGSATRLVLPNLAVGDEQAIQLQVSPDSTVAEGNYAFQLHVSSQNLATFTIPVFIAVTQSGRGHLFFHVSDIYTATLDENNQPIPGLAGARITLQNERVLTETFELRSDANGEVLFSDLPAGRYTYRASAYDHESVSGRVFVKPGITNETVFCGTNWSVSNGKSMKLP